jgi:hypothetical protein
MSLPTTIGARLKDDGTLYIPGQFDEYGDVHTGHKITKTALYADELDEVTIDLGQPSGGSIALNGTSQYLTLVSSADYQFGNDPFTIEGWFYTTDTAYQRLWSFPNGDNVEMLGSALYYWNGTSAIGTGPNVVPTYQWFHVALVKYSSISAKVFVNGKELITDTTPYNSLTSRTLAIGGEIDLSVGGYDGNPQSGTIDGYFKGNITQFRVVKGVAVYTGDFSTPISPLNATQDASHNIVSITGTATKLLLKVVGSGTLLTDSSSSGKTVTNVGTATYSSLTPLSANFNGAMKQRKDGSLLVKEEFDEVTYLAGIT